MAIITLNDLPSLKQQNKPILGLDVGDKTIGISISDSTWLIATSFKTIHRGKLARDLEELLALTHDLNCIAIVVGLPINMNGTEGPQCQKTRQLVDHLAQVTDLPICFWDERLSTMAVTRSMIQANLSRQRRSQIVDKLAASYILQGALDYCRNALQHPRN